MSTLRDALALAQLGLRLITVHHVKPEGRCSCRSPKCSHPGKHPSLGKSWQSKATSDSEALRRWFARRPNDNLGVATGRGLVVLDVDGQTGRDAIIELQRQHGGLPETALARTGSGGSHYYFRVPAGLRISNSAGTLAPG